MNMTDYDGGVVSVDASTPQSRNRRRMLMVGSLCVIGAALVAGAILIPRLTTERQVDTVAVSQPVTKSGRAQVLAGTHGTTIIVGNPGGLVGLDVDLNKLANSRNAADFPDQILIRNVEVQSVPGDQVFTIGRTRDQAILVKIEEPTLPGPKPEHVLVVRPGQHVAVSGRVEKMGSIDEVRKQWGVTGWEAGVLGNTSIYIRANTVQIQ